MQQANRHEPESPKRVLLIDIDGVSKCILKSLIKSARKYRLIVTSTFSDGLTCLKENECDAVLLAAKRLQTAYPKVIRKIHQLYPDTPIIAMGEEIDEDEGRKLIMAKAFDYVSVTGFSPEILNRAIRYAIKNRQQQKLISELRDTDPLTGLGNRQYFMRSLIKKLSAAKKSGNKVAVVSIDINNFRALNSRYGQHNGDMVVVELGHRIEQNIPESAFAARVGSDEFVLLIETSPFENVKQLISQMLKHLVASLVPKFRYGHNEMHVNCSIGVSISPDDGMESEHIMHRAILARQESKKAFETTFNFYHEGMEDADDVYTDLAPEIANALRSNQFVLHYQPQINLKNGQIEGAETLIRWQHPERGLLYPDSFIPLCEQVGLIVPIGYWIVHQACSDLQKLIAEGVPLKHLGVNLSFRQFGDDKLVPTIKRILERTKVDTSILEFELTESALHNDDVHVANCLESLSETGVSFSLDDFGTGYSSFSLLQKLPIDTIKIDRSFITDVKSSADDAEIVRAIINLAHNMGKSVIAEGVETQEQLNFLVDNGCDTVQGYFFSRPVDFETFRGTLHKCAEAVNG